MSDQTNLNVLLDGTEKKAKDAFRDRELFALADETVPALVKALRELWEAYELEIGARSDTTGLRMFRRLTAILQASSEPKGEKN
jgi:hypothetical protein